MFIPGIKQTKNNKYCIMNDKGSRNALTFNKSLKQFKNKRTINFNCLRTNNKRFNRTILRGRNLKIAYL